MWEKWSGGSMSDMDVYAPLQSVNTWYQTCFDSLLSISTHLIVPAFNETLIHINIYLLDWPIIAKNQWLSGLLEVIEWVNLVSRVLIPRCLSPVIKVLSGNCPCSFNVHFPFHFQFHFACLHLNEFFRSSRLAETPIDPSLKIRARWDSSIFWTKQEKTTLRPETR